MPFTGHEDHDISLAEAAALTKRFRESTPTPTVIAGFFGGDAIKSILAQSGCVGIRYYYGLDDSSSPVLVLVGVDANGDDLYNGELAEISFPCPEYCSARNPLNNNS